jgi:hypothetical protein
MSTEGPIAVGSVGSTGDCDHDESKWGSTFVKGISEEDSPEGALLFVKTYCRCGARIYRKTRWRDGDSIDNTDNLLRLVRKDTA